jgi:Na+-driven multidrug efflux pump
MLGTFLNAAFGFVFWIIAARLYPKGDLGMGVAIVSAMTLIGTFSLLGLDQSIIRFFPKGKEKEKFMTSVTIVILSTISLAILFLLNIDLLAPVMIILKNQAIIFILLVLIYSIFILFTSSSIAQRKGNYYFLQYLLSGSRIFLLIPFAIFGALGILYSVGIGFLIGLIASSILFVRLKIIGKPKINLDYLKKSFKFSGTNYIVNSLATSPYQLLPILVLNVLGASETATYYIAFTISSLLFLIPSSFGLSLFVEGSHGESLKQNTLHSLIGIFSLLIPLVFILYFFGGFLLGIIGKSYVDAWDLLKIMALSSFFVSIYQLFISIKKVQKDLNSLIILSVINFSLIISLSYIFMLKFGIIGMGYAWFLSYFFSTIVVILIIRKERWIRLK